jgi:hypothetical protein
MSPITANGSTDVRWLRLLADYLIPGNSRTGFLTSYLQDNDQAPKTTEPLLSQQRAHGLPPTLTGDEQILQFWQAITEGTTPQQHVSSNTSPPATRLLQQHISSSNISPPATHILSNTSHLPSCSLFPCASLYCYPQRVALSISGRRSLPVSKCAQRILAVERHNDRISSQRRGQGRPRCSLKRNASAISVKAGLLHIHEYFHVLNAIQHLRFPDDR